MTERTLLGGTDGFRGAADLDNPAMGVQNELTHYYLTSALLSLQQESGQRGPVVVARDTRPSGHRLAQASLQAVYDQGLEAAYLDVAPTPAAQKVAELTGAAATIAVTASHNPVRDNGWKGMLGSFKPDSDQVRTISERAWELHAADKGTSPLSKESPLSERRGEMLGRLYTDRLVDRITTIFGEQSLADRVVLYDGANGAGSRMVPTVLVSLGAEVRMINCGGGVINDNCGAAQEGLTSLKDAIIEGDLASNPRFIGGIANDGDADRLMAVGVIGRHGSQELVEINGNHMMYALAEGEPGIVGTLYTNTGLREKLAASGIAFDECDNGDRYVTEALRKRSGDGWRRGGEFTGHLIDFDWLCSGDGVAMAAWLCAASARQRTNFGDLYKRVPLWQESMHKVVLPEGLRISSNDPLLSDLQVWASEQMGGEGRAVIRPSGTEPVIRAWIESPHEKLPQEIGQTLRVKLQEELMARW